MDRSQCLLFSIELCNNSNNYIIVRYASTTKFIDVILLLGPILNERNEGLLPGPDIPTVLSENARPLLYKITILNTITLYGRNSPGIYWVSVRKSTNPQKHDRLLMFCILSVPRKKLTRLLWSQGSRWEEDDVRMPVQCWYCEYCSWNWIYGPFYRLIVFRQSNVNKDVERSKNSSSSCIARLLPPWFFCLLLPGLHRKTLSDDDNDR